MENWHKTGVAWQINKEIQTHQKVANDTVRYFTEGGALWSINTWEESYPH